jgi:HEAT repeat protein
MADVPEPASAPEEQPAPRQRTPFLVLQFFVFPMVIVAICVLVFVLFGLVASEGRGARDYLNEVRTGSANRRWQAAFELSKVLQAGKDPALADPGFTSEVAHAFDESAADDPRVRRYLAVALGRLGDRRAVPVLLKALEDPAAGAPSLDPDTRIYAVWALGVIGDPQALPRLLALARNEDAGLRKTAVYAVGAFSSADARAVLVASLADPVEDVRWNAALALARTGDARATPVLLQMMDRSHLSQVNELTEPQREEAMLEAVKMAAKVPDQALRASLERLRDGDSSLRIREAARAALSNGGSPHP